MRIPWDVFLLHILPYLDDGTFAMRMCMYKLVVFSRDTRALTLFAEAYKDWLDRERRIGTWRLAMASIPRQLPAHTMCFFSCAGADGYQLQWMYSVEPHRGDWTCSFPQVTTFPITTSSALATLCESLRSMPIDDEHTLKWSCVYTYVHEPGLPEPRFPLSKSPSLHSFEDFVERVRVATQALIEGTAWSYQETLQAKHVYKS